MSAVVDLAAKLPEHRPLPERDARLMIAAIEIERRKAGMSCEDLAGLAGLSRQTYQRYCSGSRLAPPVQLRRLARALTSREDQRPREESLLQALAAQRLEDLARSIDVGQARNIAIYLAHTGLGLPQRGLARLYGVSGNRINAVVKRIEERRDDGNTLDQALMALEAQLERAAGAFVRGAA
jgi:transcriptional regulator with XRE-family HTH domain